MRLDLEPYTLLYVKRGSMAMWMRRARGGDIGEPGEYDHSLGRHLWTKEKTWLNSKCMVDKDPRLIPRIKKVRNM